VTLYKHPRCYANGDGNCSPIISKEHFISASLLRRLELNKTIKVAGLSWQRPETFDLISIASFGSNILCDRHNSNLSRLDNSILQFVNTLHAIDKKQFRKDVSFSGSDIERWMLKCVVGLAFSGNAKGRVEQSWIDVLFRRANWPDRAGLYFATNSANPTFHTDSFLVETLSGQDGVIRGARIFLQGFPFSILLGKPSMPNTFGLWRPRGMIFRFTKTEARIKFKWKSAFSDTAAILSRIGAYDRPPPTWREWEKAG